MAAFSLADLPAEPQPPIIDRKIPESFSILPLTPNRVRTVHTPLPTTSSPNSAASDTKTTALHFRLQPPHTTQPHRLRTHHSHRPQSRYGTVGAPITQTFTSTTGLREPELSSNIQPVVPSLSFSPRHPTLRDAGTPWKDYCASIND